MKKATPVFEKYIFVCENKRETGDCCGAQGERLRDLLKQAVKDRGLGKRVRVSRTGCLDVCSEGPNVLVAPDYIWYQGVEEGDVGQILDCVESGLRKNG